MNKNVVAKIGHNEYKDVFYTKKCLRYPTNRIQNKNHRKELMKSTKFPCLISMIKFILDTGIDELAS